MENIDVGFMVFLADGADAIGAVREVASTSLVVYVENGGEFDVLRSSVKDVHSDKVILDPAHLDPRLLKAVSHAHDSEDPDLVG